MTSDPAREAATRIETDGFRFELAAHNCCLGLELHLEPGRAWTELTLGRRFEGWEDVAHGGIVTTILDEVMAWSLVSSDTWGVTARLAVEFRRPVHVGTPIRGEGWVTVPRRRLVDTAARIVDAVSGMELATATGAYVAANEAQKLELQARYGFRRLDSPTVAVR